MKKFALITFFVFSVFSYVEAAHKEGMVKEAAEVSRYFYFSANDNVDGNNWPYNYHIHIDYNLIFDNGLTLSARFYEKIKVNAEDNIVIPEKVSLLVNHFTIIPGDMLSFEYEIGHTWWGPYASYKMAVDRNDLKMRGWSEGNGDMDFLLE